MIALRKRDRRASVGVVTRRAETARRFAGLLGRRVPVRLAPDGRFGSSVFVQVGTVEDVKGLEVDYVVVPDADAATWPEDDDGARRAMYVAITRARTAVVLACVGEATGLWRVADGIRGHGAM